MPASNKDEVIETGFTLLLEITTTKQDKIYITTVCKILDLKQWRTVLKGQEINEVSLWVKKMELWVKRDLGS